MNQKSKLLFIFGITSLIAFLLVLILFPNQPVTTQDVRQYIDYDTQVICYILENGNGISCLPMNEVNLSE